MGRSCAPLAGVLALCGVPLAACGARTGLPVEQFDAGSENTAACVGTSVPVEPNVPNVYFVLDISGSMIADGKWSHVRSAVAGMIGDLGANARFGATVFPAPGLDQCAAGVEVMPLRLGDGQGATAGAFLAATNLVPQGGTPTAATFRSLLPKLRDLHGITFAILATDGGPNCDPGLFTCSIDQCTSNIDAVPQCFAGGPRNCCDPMQAGSGLGCLDASAASRAVFDLREVGVRTYVMGIPGSSPYGSVLDDLAIAGGTARQGQPRYYAVDSANESALASGLRDISASAMRGCVLMLGRAVADPNKVNVFVDGTLVPSGPNGWSWSGKAIALQGASCDAVQINQGVPVPPIRVVEGCATVR
jgi:hypothetical protein